MSLCGSPWPHGLAQLCPRTDRGFDAHTRVGVYFEATQGPCPENAHLLCSL